MKYHAYLRCSTDNQTQARQELQLNDWLKENKIKPADVKIWYENRSGKNADRPIYQEMMNTIQEGECLLLCELSRCHRNMANVRKMWQELIDKGAYIVVMNYRLLDTRPNDNNSLTTQLIQNLMLDVLSYTCELERSSILERTMAGKKASAEKKGLEHLEGRPQMTVAKIPVEVKKFIDNDTLTTDNKIALINAELSKNQKKPISRATYFRYSKMLKG